MDADEISKLILKYSIDDVLESKILKHNVLKLEIAIQMYESTTDFKTLNKAFHVPTLSEKIKEI